MLMFQVGRKLFTEVFQDRRRCDSFKAPLIVPLNVLTYSKVSILKEDESNEEKEPVAFAWLFGGR
jgi:hypothetical protein